MPLTVVSLGGDGGAEEEARDEEEVVVVEEGDGDDGEAAGVAAPRVSWVPSQHPHY